MSHSRIFMMIPETKTHNYQILEADEVNHEELPWVPDYVTERDMGHDLVEDVEWLNNEFSLGLVKDPGTKLYGFTVTQEMLDTVCTRMLTCHFETIAERVAGAQALPPQDYAGRYKQIDLLRIGLRDLGGFIFNWPDNGYMDDTPFFTEILTKEVGKKVYLVQTFDYHM